MVQSNYCVINHYRYCIDYIVVVDVDVLSSFLITDHTNHHHHHHQTFREFTEHDHSKQIARRRNSLSSKSIFFAFRFYLQFSKNTIKNRVIKITFFSLVTYYLIYTSQKSFPKYKILKVILVHYFISRYLRKS